MTPNSPFVFCGNTSQHLPHSWPLGPVPDEESNTCEGRPDTSHPTRLVKVRVPYLGARWSIMCAVCGPLLDKSKPWTDRESAEHVAKSHEGVRV